MTEAIWFFTESSGDMGLRSNFGSFENRMGGIYGTGSTSEMDGRMIQSASRFRRASRAIKAMHQGNAVTLHQYAVHRLTGVILHSRVMRALHRESGTTRNPADWLSRLEKQKSREWFQIRRAATADVERAMTEFDSKWRRA
jgi:hypothetical protein